MLTQHEQLLNAPHEITRHEQPSARDDPAAARKRSSAMPTSSTTEIDAVCRAGAVIGNPLNHSYQVTTLCHIRSPCTCSNGGLDLIAADRAERETAVYSGLHATLHARLVTQSCPL
jgi:hypothetical protein